MPSSTKKGIRVSGIFRGKSKDSIWGIDGDPTEGALLVAAAKAGVWREGLERKEQRIAEIPFDSERKRMAVLYKSKDGLKSLCQKGHRISSSDYVPRK